MFTGPLPDDQFVDLTRTVRADLARLGPVTVSHVRSSMAHVYRATPHALDGQRPHGVIVRVLPADGRAEEARAMSVTVALAEHLPTLAIHPLSAQVHQVPLTAGGDLAVTYWPELGQPFHDHNLATAMGAALRQLHTASPDITTGVPIHSRWYVLDWIERRLATLPDPLRTHATEFKTLLLELSVDPTFMAEGLNPYGLCHGDFKVDNTLVANDGHVRLIDWDTAHLGFRCMEFTKWAMRILIDQDCQDCMEAAFDGWLHATPNPDRARTVCDQFLRSPAVAFRAWNAGYFPAWLATFPPTTWDPTPYVETALAATKHWYPNR